MMVVDYAVVLGLSIIVQGIKVIRSIIQAAVSVKLIFGAFGFLFISLDIFNASIMVALLVAWDLWVLF